MSIIVLRAFGISALVACLSILGLSPVRAQSVMPMPHGRCHAIGQTAANALAAEVQMVERAGIDNGDVQGKACIISMSGNGFDWVDAMQVVDRFFSHFTDWQPDFSLSQEGATAERQGFRKDDQLILMKAEWVIPPDSCSQGGPTCLTDPRRRMWTVRIEAMRYRD